MVRFKRLSYLAPIIKKRAPGQLVIQMTDQCNARCPQCGMRVMEKFDRSTISPDVGKRIIDSAAAKGIQAISFTGGEPFLEIELLVELIDYAASAGIRFIRTGTNGFFFRDLGGPYFEDRIKKIADLLGETKLRNLWISIDSSEPQMHESMRGLSGVVQGIEKALPIFHDRGIYPSANLGINRGIAGRTMISLVKNEGISAQERNDDFHRQFLNAFNDYYSFIINVGFTMVNACYPMSTLVADQSIKSVYAADSTANMINFSAEEKGLMFKALFDAIPAFRHRIRIFSPRMSLYALWKAYADNDNNFYGCRGGIDFFFIDAKENNTYPCGYRGNEDLGKFWDLELNGPAPTNAQCRKCDWECFRDPSQLFGPLLHIIKSPLGYVKRVLKNPTTFKLWIEDLFYYKVCEFFDGRKPPDYSQMQKYGP
jgi:MoaA/NifB/PqqE/SkfB family radical SAM enzyme